MGVTRRHVRWLLPAAACLVVMVGVAIVTVPIFYDPEYDKAVDQAVRAYEQREKLPHTGRITEWRGTRDGTCAVIELYDREADTSGPSVVLIRTDGRWTARGFSDDEQIGAFDPDDTIICDEIRGTTPGDHWNPPENTPTTSDPTSDPQPSP